MASWVCMSGFVPNWRSVSVFRSSVCVVSLAMRRPLQIFRHFLTEQYRENEFPGIWTYLHRDVDIFSIWTFLRALQQRILRGRGSKLDI